MTSKNLEWWMNLTKEEIDIVAEKSVINIEKFEKEVSSCKPYQAILLFNIHVEQVSRQYLTDSFPNSSALNIKNMGAGLKIDLVEALGIAEKDVIEYIRYVSSVRNKISHGLNFEIDKRTIISIIKKTPRKIYENEKFEFSYDDSNFEEILVKSLTFVLIYFEFFRQSAIKRRMIDSKLWAEVHFRMDKLGIGSR